MEYNDELQPKKTKKSKKTSKTLLFIGIPLLLAGIGTQIFTILNIEQYFFLSFVAMPLIAGGFVCTMMGTIPYITKVNAKLQKEALDYAGSDLQESATLGAEVVSPATKTMAKAIKEGFSEMENDPQMYCKHCGKSIDADSKFCNHCGKEQ